MKITILNSLFDMSTLALKNVFERSEISEIQRCSDIAYDMNNTLIKKSEMMMFGRRLIPNGI